MKFCQHKWEPVTHYGQPGTGFEMCHECGEIRGARFAKTRQELKPRRERVMMESVSSPNSWMSV